MSLHHSPPSPLTEKRRRLNSAPAFDQANTDTRVDGVMTPPAPVAMLGTPSRTLTHAAPSPRMQHSMDSLEAASQVVRLGLAMKEQSNKSTPATYERHINHYVDWWTSYQAVEINGDLTKTVIPAFPITAAKATMFLDYTSTRAKVSSFENSFFKTFAEWGLVSAQAR